MVGVYSELVLVVYVVCACIFLVWWCYAVFRVAPLTTHVNHYSSSQVTGCPPSQAKADYGLRIL